MPELTTKGDRIHETLPPLREEADTQQASLLASLETSGVPLIERRYSRGEHAYMRGDPDEGLWFLLEGIMEVYKLYGAFSKATVRLLDGSRTLRRTLPATSGASPRLGRGALCLPGGEGAQGPPTAPPLGGFELCPSTAPSLSRVRRGARSCGAAAARAEGRQPAGEPFAGASGALRGGRPREGIEDAPEPPRPLLHGGVHARGRLQGHGRVQGGRSHRDAEAATRRRAGRAAPEQGGDGTGDNGTGRVHGGCLAVLGDACARIFLEGKPHSTVGRGLPGPILGQGCYAKATLLACIHPSA